LRLLEVVQSREAPHGVDISVPETLWVIHKPHPSTYKAGVELPFPPPASNPIK